MPTATLEEYLETIYKLSERGPAKPTQIAEEIGVSGPTVTNTLKRLEAAGLVRRDGTDVVLTDEGRAHSIDIIRRHRIAERFLVDVLGIDWHDVHEDACLLEHALSPRVLAALETYLDNPEVCPHGHPIPAADGTVRTVSGFRAVHGHARLDCRGRPSRRERRCGARVPPGGRAQARCRGTRARSRAVRRPAARRGRGAPAPARPRDRRARARDSVSA